MDEHIINKIGEYARPKEIWIVVTVFNWDDEDQYHEIEPTCYLSWLDAARDSVSENFEYMYDEDLDDELKVGKFPYLSLVTSEMILDKKSTISEFLDSKNYNEEDIKKILDNQIHFILNVDKSTNHTVKIPKHLKFTK